jgi:hypothetical protein
MEPSTILIALLCLALLVYLPKLRNTVFWIFFPFVMVLIRYPKTRKPGLVLGCLGLVAWGTWYGISSYRESHYWYCDIWRNKDHSVTVGRISEQGMQCFRGLAACIANRDKPVPPSVADIFKDAWDYDGERCGHQSSSIWSYDIQETFVPDKGPEQKLDLTEQFLSKWVCDEAQEANRKIATSPCYQDEKQP